VVALECHTYEQDQSRQGPIALKRMKQLGRSDLGDLIELVNRQRNGRYRNNASIGDGGWPLIDRINSTATYTEIERRERLVVMERCRQCSAALIADLVALWLSVSRGSSPIPEIHSSLVVRRDPASRECCSHAAHSRELELHSVRCCYSVRQLEATISGIHGSANDRGTLRTSRYTCWICRLTRSKLATSRHPASPRSLLPRYRFLIDWFVHSASVMRARSGCVRKMFWARSVTVVSLTILSRSCCTRDMASSAVTAQQAAARGEGERGRASNERSSERHLRMSPPSAAALPPSMARITAK